MTQQTMIDRVAEAIANACYDAVDSEDDCCSSRMALVAARAAIEAMREPTEAMVDASELTETTGGPNLSTIVWYLMIDAALGVEKP